MKTFSIDTLQSPSIGLVFPEDAPIDSQTLNSARGLLNKINLLPGQVSVRRVEHSVEIIGPSSRRLTISGDRYSFFSNAPSVYAEGVVDACPDSLLTLFQSR